ncbi:hypothetical protein H4Q26_006337 [Puccinia striiformis f. sp. tritici PST-130]|nr:hypothetical protein H4Q26_006337 [Puccinia striiformis f. sp. tritici PST-130]
MDDLSRQLSSWNIQKPTPFISSSHVPHEKLEKDHSTYTCHYCGAKGHSLHRCNSQTTDEIKKLCRKEGANIVMPDGTHLPFDRNTPYKVAVDKWHAERKHPIKLPPGLHTQQMEPNIFQSSFGELEFLDYAEESGATYDCDVGIELKNKEEVPETPSAKNIRQEQEDSMDEEQGLMDKFNLPDIDYGTPEPRKNSPLKKIQIKAPENISIKKEASLAEESPVIVVSETLKEPLLDLESNLNILEEMEIKNVEENLHTCSTEVELNQSAILTTMDNLGADVLPLDVDLENGTCLAISLETCVFQKDPGRTIDNKINLATIKYYTAYSDLDSAYQLRCSRNILPNSKPSDPPQITLRPHFFYFEEVKIKNYIDQVNYFGFIKQRIKSAGINNNYIESLILPVFLPRYINNQLKLVSLYKESIISNALGRTLSKLNERKKKGIRYFCCRIAVYTQELDYTPSELIISQWQRDMQPSSKWQQWSLPKDNSRWFDGSCRCCTTRMVNSQWLTVWRWRRMACKAIMVEKEKKDWLKIQRSEWRRDGIRNLKARDPMSNAQQHKKSIGENRHRLLSDVTRRATQKKTSNLSAYLSQRPWSFPSTREVLITYSNLFTSAVPTTSSFYFFLPAQSVVYERTRLNHANLFSGYYSERGRRHHRTMTDASLSLLVILFHAINDGYQTATALLLPSDIFKNQQTGPTHTKRKRPTAHINLGSERPVSFAMNALLRHRFLPRTSSIPRLSDIHKNKK